MCAALAFNARRLGGPLPEGLDSLPCSLQGKNKLNLLTEEVRKINVTFSRKHATALQLLSTMPRLSKKPTKKNVVQLSAKQLSKAEGLPSNLKDFLKKTDWSSVETEADEIVTKQPQQVSVKPKKVKQTKRKEELPKPKAVEVAKPVVKPVVKVEAKRKAEPTSLDSKGLSPWVLRHYLTRIQEGKMTGARMFLRDCAGLTYNLSMKEYTERENNLKEFIAEHIGEIKAAILTIEPSYSGEAEHVGWSANGKPVDVVRSKRIKNWFKRDGKMHSKGWTSTSFKQIIPEGLNNWLELNNPPAKRNGSPIAVQLGLKCKMSMVNISRREAVRISGIKVGVRYINEHIEVPVGPYEEDRMLHLTRRYNSDKEAGFPIEDTPTPPAVAAAVASQRNVEVSTTSEIDNPPWVMLTQEVITKTGVSFLTPELYNSRRLEQVAKFVEEEYRPFLTDEVYNERRLERVAEGIIESDILWSQGIKGFNDAPVLASAPQPEALTQDETETLFLDSQGEMDVMMGLREEFQKEWTLFSPKNHFRVPHHRIGKVKRAEAEAEHCTYMHNWIHNRSSNHDSYYEMYTENQYLVALSNTWRSARKQDAKELRQLARNARKMSDTLRYQQYWDNLKPDAQSAIFRMDLRDVKPAGRVLCPELSKIGRKRIKKLKRLEAVDWGKWRRRNLLIKQKLEEKRKAKVAPTPVENKAPITSDTVVGMSGDTPTPTLLTAPFIQMSTEQRIISSILNDNGVSSGWAGSANTLLRGKVVDINIARDLLKHFSQNTEGILVPS